MNRRQFIQAGIGATVGLSLGACMSNTIDTSSTTPVAGGLISLKDYERTRVLKDANGWLNAKPGSITYSRSPIGPSDIHEYFSEPDYWWPDSKNPNGPPVDRDGFSNPNNFLDNRLAMIRLSRIVPAMAAAYLITGDPKYAVVAAAHLRVWFLDTATYMKPNLEYGQMTPGAKIGGRIGIIDTLHLAEVARSIPILETSGKISSSESDGLRQWFSQYLTWMDTSKLGIAERDCANNHATCWIVQAASFAHLTGDAKVFAQCRELLVKSKIPGQIAADGSLPLELKRTKPYSYSLFDMDMLGIACQILSHPADNPLIPPPGDKTLWTIENPKGASVSSVFEYYYPYIVDRNKWPFKHDVEYWGDFPVRNPSLLFTGLVLQEQKYIDLWKTLDPDPTVGEVIRNWPVRQPVLWVDAAV
jgi:Alginate lyase